LDDDRDDGLYRLDKDDIKDTPKYRKIKHKRSPFTNDEICIKLNKFLTGKKKGSLEGYSAIPNYSFLHRISKYEDPTDSDLRVFGERIEDAIMMTGKLSSKYFSSHKKKSSKNF
jgi:hypothetical protein